MLLFVKTVEGFFSLFLMIKNVKSPKPEIDLDKKNGENILHSATGNTRIKDFRTSSFMLSFFQTTNSILGFEFSIHCSNDFHSFKDH